jgi:ribosomal protein L37AE/L43A
MWQMYQHSPRISLRTYSCPPGAQGEVTGRSEWTKRKGSNRTSSRELRVSRAKGNTVKKLTYISSNTNSIICPCCGINELERSADGVVGCSRCDRPISTQVLKTLEQIVSLPDAIGSHACECGHPEMRPLADGVLWCPGCGSEVLPPSAS